MHIVHVPTGLVTWGGFLCGLAAILLALAVGVKVWPVILLPFVLRPVFKKPGKLLPAICIFTLIAGAMFVTVYLGGMDHSSGFTVYRQRWEKVTNRAFS